MQSERGNVIASYVLGALRLQEIARSSIEQCPLSIWLNLQKKLAQPIAYERKITTFVRSVWCIKS